MSNNDVKIKYDNTELNRIMRMLKEDWVVRIGILGSKAAASHDSKSGLTNAQLGAVHEMGANINHPGGTPYKILGNGRALFVSKKDGEGLPVTGPHEIKIPQRSFLEIPLKKELAPQMKEMKGVIFKQFFVKKAPKEFFMAIASKGLAIVQSAFSEGRPEWSSLTAATKRRKEKLGQSPNTLVTSGRGGLSSTISTKVFKR